MPQAVDSIASELQQLTEQVQNLERRIAALEGRSQESTSSKAEGANPALAVPALQTPRAPATSRGFPPVETPAGAITVVGKAVLGIAGAYLLRAIAESGAIPKLPVLIAAMVYAGFWMVWAARIHAVSQISSAAYAITSALILSPLLWESTVRFQVLPPVFAAAVLVAFVVLGLALARRSNLQLIPWVATVAAVITALALIIGTHDFVPLTAALLAVSVATEAAACLGHRLSLRAVPAIAADLAVWLVIDLMTAERVPFDYRPIAPATIAGLCLALPAIYGGSIGVRCFALRRQITIFEIAQAVVAFSLASFGALRATHGSAAPGLGLLFLLLAAACYWGLQSRFAEAALTRTRLVCATWSAALLLAASSLLFSASVRVLFLCVAAVAAVVAHARTRQFSLGIHASFYLVAATAVSSLPLYVGNALAGTIPAAPDWDVWIVALAAALCYPIGARGAEDRTSRLLWIVPAALVGFAAAALAVVAIVFLASGHFLLDAPQLSVIRTVVNCALALALVFLGSRLKHPELRWVAYAAVAFGTLKLLFEDLRFGNAASLVVSLLFYGLILILLPRLTRGETNV